MLTWIDVGTINRAAGHPEARLGVCYRSTSDDWMVTAETMDSPTTRWLVWDVRSGRPRRALPGVSHASLEAGQRVASALADSTPRRLAAGLWTVSVVYLRSYVQQVVEVLRSEVRRPPAA